MSEWKATEWERRYPGGVACCVKRAGDCFAWDVTVTDGEWHGEVDCGVSKTLRGAQIAAERSAADEMDGE